MVPYVVSASSEESSLHKETGYLCPHIEAVTIIQDYKITQVNPSGTVEARSPGDQNLSGRGSIVCLTFHTEDGRRFYITYQFHKGDVFRSVSECEPIKGLDYDDPATYPKELWRD